MEHRGANVNRAIHAAGLVGRHIGQGAGALPKTIGILS